MNWKTTITFGIFLILFGWWINPLMQEGRYKKRCVELIKREIINQGEVDSYDSLTDEEEAFYKAYRDCNTEMR